MAKGFVLNGIDVSVLQNLSKRAQRYWLALLAKADGKTGELRFGKHWFTPEELGRAAKLSPVTRKKALRELRAVGLVDVKRDRVDRDVCERHTGLFRKHQVLDCAHTYVSKSPRHEWVYVAAKPEKPTLARIPSMAQKLYRRRGPQKQRVNAKSEQHGSVRNRASSTVSFVNGTGTIPTIESPDFTQQPLAGASPLPSALEPANPSASAVRPAFAGDRESGKYISPGEVAFASESPQAKPAKPSPLNIFIGTGPLAHQRYRLADRMRDHLRDVIAENNSTTFRLQEIFKIYKQSAKALCVDWRDFETLYNQIVRDVEEALTPTPTNSVDPIPPLNDAKLAEIASHANECTEFHMDDDCGVLVYPNGTETLIPGELAPVWHPY